MPVAAVLVSVHRTQRAFPGGRPAEVQIRGHVAHTPLQRDRAAPHRVHDRLARRGCLRASQQSQVESIEGAPDIRLSADPGGGTQPAVGVLRVAKGGGDVVLWVQLGKSELVLSSDRFTPELLDWFRPVAAGLTEIFPGRVLERDNGYDA